MLCDKRHCAEALSPNSFRFLEGAGPDEALTSSASFKGRLELCGSVSMKAWGPDFLLLCADREQAFGLIVSLTLCLKGQHAVLHAKCQQS